MRMPMQAWSWTQEGRRVWLECEAGRFHWDMPRGFNLKSTHPDLLRLAAHVLLKPWVPGILDGWIPSRKPGRHASLAFSGGVDSTVAMLLMPRSTRLAYHERDFESMLKHDNALRLIGKLRWPGLRKVQCIPSDHEKIRTHWDHRPGFSTDYAAAVHLILLADHLNLATIALGTPIDNAYLWKGHRFRDFASSSHWLSWSELFRSVGLELHMPIASITEGGCLSILKRHRQLLPFVNSCMRGVDGAGCEKCWKCFHKNGPLRRPYDVESREISNYLQKRPLRTATHAIWWIQRGGHFDRVPDLAQFKELDLSWWTGYYPPAFELLPGRWREHTEKRIRHWLEEMPEPYALEQHDIFPDAP